MRAQLPAVVCVAFLCVVGIAREDKPKPDTEVVRGTWVAVSGEENGVPIVGVKGGRAIFTEEEITFMNDKKEVITKATYKLDPTKKPKEILICIKAANVDTFAKGIYQIDGDELKICWGSAGAEGKIPSEFATKVGSGNKLMIYKRDKP